MNKYLTTAFCFLMFTSLIAQTSDERTLFTVGGDKVTVSDFEYVYNKNNINNQSDYSEKSLRDYLGLYENFRLKVKEAEAMQLDTIPSLKNELEGYRKQLAKSYLSDREITDKLIAEAYERSKTEVNASHILIRVSEDANPADTLAAYKKILALKKKIEKTVEDEFKAAPDKKNPEALKAKLLKAEFAKVAKESSEDPSAKNNSGDIGWFSVFGTIYPFETAAYTLKKGEMSEVVRTEFGYHLVMLDNTRPARGQIHVAHLLLRFPDKATEAQKDSVKKRIDVIYADINSGKITFDDAVKKFSEDKSTRAKSGELQWFGTGTTVRMIPEFEDAAFALKKDGDITKPVETQFGYHLIKRLERKDLQSFNDVKNDLKKKVERDSRSEEAKTVLIERIKKENGFKEDAENRAAFDAKVDSGIFKGNWKAGSDLRNGKTLFTLAGKNYTTDDFADYVEKMAKKRSDKNKAALMNEYYDGFVINKCLDYEESTLETKKPEFRNLMKEYKDGILLFELMDRMVWTKAVKDSVGLEEYRKNNQSKYMWGNRAEVAIFNTNDMKAADEAYKLAEKKKNVDEIKEAVNKKDEKEKDKGRVSVIEGKYEKGQYDVVDKVDWKPGLTPIKKINDSSYQFILIKQIVGPEPKSLKEAKGYIVSDYQEYLEKTWLDQLRKKYPIVLDEKVFSSLVKKK